MESDMLPLAAAVTKTVTVGYHICVLKCIVFVYI